MSFTRVPSSAAANGAGGAPAVDNNEIDLSPTQAGNANQVELRFSLSLASLEDQEQPSDTETLGAKPSKAGQASVARL
jgi:hypothetical protein